MRDESCDAAIETRLVNPPPMALPRAALQLPRRFGCCNGAC